MQQSGYQGKKFLKWLKHKENLYFNRLALLSGLLLLSCAVFSLTFSLFSVQIGNFLSALPFIFFCILFIVCDGKYALKVPLKFTERVRRLSIAYAFLLACVSYLVIASLLAVNELIASEIYGVFAYLPVCLLPMLTPFVLWLANAVISPYEQSRNQKFVQKANDKLNQTEMLKIGVVGSFAKTSVKHILATLLSEKYTVVSTPESYNTPLGLAKTVFSPAFENKQVLIAEMGARKIGDIAELCALVEPDCAVFTGVCEQHIESFGSIENVWEGKSEIFAGVKNFVVCGKTIKSRFAKLSQDIQEKCVFVQDTAVKDVKYRATETEFTLSLQGEEIAVKTKLLGEGAVENILLAVTLCEKLGLSSAEIQQGLQKITPVPHRLELVESAGAYILDDAYNSNPEGAKMALNALKRFTGKKIVVTPGIVETGILNEAINGKLGEELVGFDQVILVGDTLVTAVKNGYLTAGGKAEQITVVPTLEKAEDILGHTLSTGDAVLFLNDLPDVY